MSDRLLRALAGAGALVCAARAPLGAQPADSALARAVRIDSLYGENRIRVDSVERTIASTMAWAYIHEGAFSLRASPTLAERARAGARLASAALAARGGALLEGRLATRQPVIAVSSARPPFRAPVAAIAVADTGREWRGGMRVPLTAPLRAASIGDALVGIAERAALDGTDGVVAQWLAGAGVPLREASRAEWSEASADLGMIASAALRRCRAGDDASCLGALGLDQKTSWPDQLAAWYAPTDFRAMLRRALLPPDDSATVASAVRCRATGDEGACAAAARALPARNVPPPVSAVGRRLFLDEVLRAGGAGAYERLLGARGSAAERLTSAAGVPLDGVARAWRARLERSRPAAAAVSPLAGLATLGWCGALFGLTAIRRGR